ncbi:hypothetical protein NUU61_005673 [Penicillium alfredii]|uniref:Uncharacterized protein n=1 Tax=Penicillium alfredii TaxID=1506179 RepID=A0A9W9K8V7_9EURO|nr:uncharacterized protein NUU61_005673 [Penicillium alfredii]KAJ5096317.1 hypothetical protein NUU61_005673 [Penicillium alfredii]
MSSKPDSEPNTASLGEGFLGDLGPQIKRYQYQGIGQFLAIRAMQCHRQQEDLGFSEWILFTGVEPQAFTRDFLNTNDKNILRSWSAYDKTLRLLLAIMPVSPAHGAAATAFDRQLFEALKPLGLDESIRSTGPATRSGEHGARQPDCQFLPNRRPSGRTDDWPSLVVEVAFSESPSKLNASVRYWFQESKGDVKTVITLRINQTRPSLVFEKWENNNGRERRQQVVAVQKGENNHVYVQPQNGALTIDFDKLFLRQPSQPRETDIQFGEVELKKSLEKSGLNRASKFSVSRILCH